MLLLFWRKEKDAGGRPVEAEQAHGRSCFCCLHALLLVWLQLEWWRLYFVWWIRGSEEWSSLSLPSC